MCESTVSFTLFQDLPVLAQKRHNNGYDWATSTIKTTLTVNTVMLAIAVSISPLSLHHSDFEGRRGEEEMAGLNHSKSF